MKVLKQLLNLILVLLVIEARRARRTGPQVVNKVKDRKLFCECGETIVKDGENQWNQCMKNCCTRNGCNKPESMKNETNSKLGSIQIFTNYVFKKLLKKTLEKVFEKMIEKILTAL